MPINSTSGGLSGKPYGLIQTTIPTAPSKPTVSSVPNEATDVVTWNAPTLNGGSTITSYTWESTDSKTGSTSSTSTNVAQEDGTTQQYRVKANNINGSSPWSEYSDSFTSFSFTPFGFTPFGFTPFGFTPFGFTPVEPFGFTPFSPFNPGYSEYSVASTTGIMTVNGRKDAKDIVVGDILFGMEIDNSVNDWINWSTNSLVLDESNVKQTTVVSISSKNINQLYLINGDLYSESHYILTKKDNVIKFTRVNEIDNSYLVYSFADFNFINIDVLEIVEYEDTVYSINCEPYDNFFTENMLVFDAKDLE